MQNPQEGFVVYLRRLNGLVCVRIKRGKGRPFKKGEGTTDLHGLVLNGGGHHYSMGFLELDRYVENPEQVTIDKPFEFFIDFDPAANRFKEVFLELHKHNEAYVDRINRQLRSEIDSYNAAISGIPADLQRIDI